MKSESLPNVHLQRRVASALTVTLGAFCYLNAVIGCAPRAGVALNRTGSIPAYESYRLEKDILAKLPLSARQRGWIRTVGASPGYSDYASALRVSLLRGIKTPIVVFESSLDDDSHERGGHVIGEDCDVLFDPYGTGLFAGSQASCSPPTPAPVTERRSTRRSGASAQQ